MYALITSYLIFCFVEINLNYSFMQQQILYIQVVWIHKTNRTINIDPKSHSQKSSTQLLCTCVSCVTMCYVLGSTGSIFSYMFALYSTESYIFYKQNCYLQLQIEMIILEVVADRNLDMCDCTYMYNIRKISSTQLEYQQVLLFCSRPVFNFSLSIGSH